MEIRKILKKDNGPLAKTIRGVFEEMGIAKVGTAYEDESLDDLYSYYQKPRAVFFVVENDGDIIGGAGIAQLENSVENICELQKMYLSKEGRGHGLGKELLKRCLKAAAGFKYEKVYLETMPYMDAARKLYADNGFANIDGPQGDTGHYSCQLWMIKELQN